MKSFNNLPSLLGIKRGFERECLRVNTESGMLSATPHPTALGSSLIHPMITTDFSEALLEFITPPTEDLHLPFKMLLDLHVYTNQHLENEFLWLSSMPCTLPKEADIPIAQYGTSNFGQLKHIYRRGLANRYGRVMQTISGIHYNFSLSDDFWQKYYEDSKSTLSKQDFISEQYLGLIRNSLRLGWLLPLLFGASPCSDTSIEPYATSLRLSDSGYHNRTQSKNQISYNSLAEFLETMQKAVHTPLPEYTAMGVLKNGTYNQLSDCVFQVEDEHYASVRPKRVSGLEERMLAAILRDGIEYIEVRALDINPFVPIGIDPEMVYLLDAFLVYCLLIESPPLTDAENQRIQYNHNQIVKQGRQPGLTLLDELGQTRDVIAWAEVLLTDIQKIAVLLDKAYDCIKFTQACAMAKKQISAPETLPSARVLEEMRSHGDSYFDFARRWSLKHQQYFKTQLLSNAEIDKYSLIGRDSLLAQKRLENNQTVPFDEYLRRYLST
jgi:glutamate--cysteine ligase